MAIEPVGAGQAVTDLKINEVIDTVNDLLERITSGGLNAFAWVRFSPSSGMAILGQSGNIGTLTDVGSGVRLTFTNPFDNANDYGAVCTSSAIPGKTTGISQWRTQTASYVEFGWVVDDGATGYPTDATIILGFNVSL